MDYLTAHAALVRAHWRCERQRAGRRCRRLTRYVETDPGGTDTTRAVCARCRGSR